VPALVFASAAEDLCNKMAGNGIPVRTIQAWLGHKNLETTMIYLGVTDVEKLRPQIDRAFGD